MNWLAQGNHYLAGYVAAICAAAYYIPALRIPMCIALVLMLVIVRAERLETT